ncbi:response regulator transcription factor [Leucobacter sp.]
MIPRPLRVRLLNDYELVVMGLRTILEPFASRVQVVEVDVRDTADREVDLTLYDTFGRPRAAGDAVDEVVADPRSGAVVVYTWNTHEDLIARALDHGCRGYIDKSSSAAELVGALERIHAGEIVTSPAREHPAEETAVSAGAWPGQREGLSAREAEVIALITQGLTNPEIAQLSYITLNSLKSYIRSAYRKMGVERRSQAVRWGIEHGMLPDEGA